MPPLIEQIEQLWPSAEWLDLQTAVALSGGADSVALLRMMAAIKKAHAGRGGLFALHVNHNLRGQQSDDDQTFCEQLCQQLEVPLQALSGHVVPRAEAEGDGLESAARNERYALLVERCEQLGARLLVMAHTQDDQVETILFRLLRGTGLRGLLGIPFTRELTPSLAVVRPLLGTTRVEILAYLDAIQQPFREDSSNTDLSLTRNRLRNELLPQLRDAYNPMVDQALLRLADQAAEHVELCERLAEESLAHAPVVGSGSPAGGFSLRVAALQDQPLLVNREALRLAWRQAGLAEQDMTHALWCQLAELASPSAGKAVLNLPGRLRARNSAGLLIVEQLPGTASS